MGKKYAVIVIILLGQHVYAQSPPDTAIQLEGALKLALQNYPLLKQKKLEADAAIKQTEVVKYGFLPSVDAGYQANLSTANNLTGQFNPGGMLPLTGPPSTSNNYTPALGSAASLLLNWQAVTFGQHNAQLALAKADAGSKTAALQQEAFNHQVNVISKYLDLLLSYDILNVRRNNLLRVKENLRQSTELAKSGIKPGADTALFLSELSKAKVALLNGEKDLQANQWQLARLLVTNALPVPADSLFLHRLPGTEATADTAFEKHPLMQFAQKQYEANQYREQLLKKSWLPKLSFWGTVFARGSGFEANGSIKALDGLALSRYNYGAGLQLSFPIMKYGETKLQVQQQSLLTRAAQQQVAETQNNLYTQQGISNNAFSSSVAIAAETEKQLAAARYAFNAVQTRYNTGLVNFADLIQAQYNLLTAELDVKKAYWDAWTALLMQAAVKGDINIFMQQTR